MHAPSYCRRDGRRVGEDRQQGQAIVYGIFMLLVSLLALFYLFNTGQLSREKTKLVNTADAVAYSAGLLHARTLNFDAYSNRAMIANEVVIAQMASVGSWAKYVEAEGKTYSMGYPDPSEFVSFGLGLFVPSYTVAAAARMYMGALNSAAKGTADISDTIVQNILMTAQATLHSSLVVARASLMQEVADLNYQGQGPVKVDLIPIQSDLGTSGDQSLDSKNQAPFIKKYEKDERTRFADVVKIAAYKDSFVEKRSWTMPALWPSCFGTNGALWDWITRRGGTELIGFDEWKAMDTVSWFHWVNGGSYTGFACVPGENPIGYGAQPIYKDSDDDNFSNVQYYDYSRTTNPTASFLADGQPKGWKFSGIPSFYDLTESMLKEGDPRLKFAIRLTRNRSDTRTSEGASPVKPSGRLDKFHGKPASDVLAAMSASEVFFQRPDDQINNCDGAKYGTENCYGRGINKAQEIGSLFNPFWQVHLISPSSSNLDTAYGQQGATPP